MQEIWRHVRKRLFFLSFKISHDTRRYIVRCIFLCILDALAETYICIFSFLLFLFFFLLFFLNRYIFSLCGGRSSSVRQTCRVFSALFVYKLNAEDGWLLTNFFAFRVVAFTLSYNIRYVYSIRYTRGYIL